MVKLIFGLGVATGSAATALALSEGGRNRVRGWLRERGAEMNEDSREETRGNLERFGAAVQARTGDALSKASRTLGDETAVGGPLTS